MRGDDNVRAEAAGLARLTRTARGLALISLRTKAL